MLKKIKELAGMERVVFETLGAMILISVAYLIAYWLSGNAVVAVVAAAVAVAAVVFAAATVAATSLVLATVAVVVAAAVAAVVAVATSLVLATVVAVVVAAAVAVAAVVFAVVVAEYYNVKYWKVLLFYFAEEGLLIVAFTVAVPYITIGLLAVAIVALGVILLRKRNAVASG